MAASEYFGLAQFLIAILFMLFASYSDMKIRRVSDIIWVAMGLTAIILITWQILLLQDINIVLLMGIIPILGIFCYFLICEWVFDFEEKKINFPWISILLISILLILCQSYWAGLGSLQLTLILVFFIIFLSLEFTMFFMDYKYYSGFQTGIKSTSENDGVKAKKIDRITMSSWVLLLLISFETILAIYVHQYKSSYTNYIIAAGVTMGLIPILIFILYLIYFEWSLTPGRDYPVQNNSPEKPSTSKSDVPDEDNTEEFQPRRQGIFEKLGWAALAMFGFFLIINMVTIVQFNDPSKFFKESADNTKYYQALFSVSVWLVIFYAFYNLGIPRGGADTKALMALSVLFPMYVIFEDIMLSSAFIDLISDLSGVEYIITFTFSLLMNAAIITVFIPISLIIYNATKGDLKFPQGAFGYKMKLTQVAQKHVWIMDRIDDDNKVYTVLSPGNIEREDQLIKDLRKLGKKTVWVTPKIPFIIPMTLGLVINFVIGNIIFVILSAISGI